MLCPRCSEVFDKKATDGLKKYIPFAKNKGNWPNSRVMARQNMAHTIPIHQRLGYPTTFVPPNKTPVNKWFHGHSTTPIRNSVERGSSSNSKSNQHQRQKKFALQNVQSATENKGRQIIETDKEPVKERLSQPVPIKEIEDKVEDENMEDDDLLESDPDFDVLVNVVSILPTEYDVWSEVTDGEDEFGSDELALHKPMCYYVMNNGCMEEQMATFERPTEGMKNHLKPLFIQAKVNNVGVNKVLIDGGA
ncbi:hypothetical protein L195_g023945, partial [Trifolium pratense]